MKTLISKTTKLYLIIVAGLLIAGCGGGGDSSGTSVSGKAIDGYIRGATLCLDKNYNFTCDEDEPTTTSQSGGVYTLGISSADLDNYPIVVVAGSEAFDEGRGSYFSKTLKLTAPSGVTTITPITTLVQGKISEGKSRSEAESEVATLLGISTSSLYTDYEASNDTTLQNIAYNIATIMQNNGNDIAKTIIALGGGSTSSSDSSSGGGSTGGGDTPISSVSISSTFPSSGATGVGPYTWIDIVFSGSIDSSTVTTTNITLDNSKSCQSIEYISSSNTARCYPYVTSVSNALAEDTQYTVSLSGLKDSSGNTMADSSFSFTTGKRNVLPRLRTGQTTSYTANDDYWYVTNGGLGIARSFTRDDVNGIVTDNASGLMWQDNGAGGTPTWANAGTYCDGLTLGGQSDWRLPTIDELATIANKSASNPAKFTEFQNVTSSYYWSATTLASDTTRAWRVGFDYGSDSWDDKTSTYSVRCVRGGQSVSPSYIRDSTKEVVLDTSSGLMWQDDEIVKTTTRTWGEAITYCEDQIGTSGTYAGYSDWRLPNYEELYSLADRSRYNPAISHVFQNVTSFNFWSATTYASVATYAWGVYFYYGLGNWLSKAGTNYVRCVRGGQ